MNDKLTGAFALFGIALFIPGILAFGAIWNGYVLSILWLWFIVPAFALPVLSLPYAIGVALTIRFITFQYIYSKDDRTAGKRIGMSISTTILTPAFVLFVGWIVKGFV